MRRVIREAYERRRKRGLHTVIPVLAGLPKLLRSRTERLRCQAIELGAGCIGAPIEAIGNLLALAAVAGVVGVLALPVPIGSAIPVAARTATASAEPFEVRQPMLPASAQRQASTARVLGAVVSSPDLPASGAAPKAKGAIEVERGIGISARSIASGEFDENRNVSDENDLWVSCNPESVVKRTACDAYDAAVPP